MYQQYSDLYFTTATILEWKSLLEDDALKDIIIKAFKFLAANKYVTIWDFVIMPNHIHVIWAVNAPYSLAEVKSMFLSWTAHRFKKHLFLNNSAVLKHYEVNAADRHFQFWERNALSVPVYSDTVFRQKQNYIHNNPCVRRWQLADEPENYRYSSAYRPDELRFWEFLEEWHS